MSSAQVFDFSSVGDRLPQLREAELSREPTKINYNIATPLKLSQNGTDLFQMNTDLGSAVSDNLKNLLKTNRGERVMQPDFGANLKSILTEFGTPGFEGEVMARIKTSVKKYLPFVSLGQMRLEKLETPVELGIVAIQVGITYSVPATGLSNESINVVLNTVA